MTVLLIVHGSFTGQLKKDKVNIFPIKKYLTKIFKYILNKIGALIVIILFYFLVIPFRRQQQQLAENVLSVWVNDIFVTCYLKFVKLGFSTTCW